MPIAAGTVILGKQFAGWVAESADISSAVATTTTEVVSTSITFTAVTGVRYKVTYQGNAESTATNDGITVRLRWKNTSTPDTTGTIFAKGGITEFTGTLGQNFMLVGTFTGQTAGALTVVATIFRNLGTGTVRQYAPSNNGQLMLVVEVI